MAAYEDMIRHTGLEGGALVRGSRDNKWFTRVVVAAAIIDTLASLVSAIRRSPRRSCGSSRAKRGLLGGK